MSVFGNVVSYLTDKQTKLFFIDAAGALLTACCLFLLTYFFENGDTAIVTGALCGVACCFFTYSFLCFLFIRNTSAFHLRVVAIMNSLYACTTFIFVAIAYDELSPFSLAYFPGEMVILFILARVEWSVAMASQESRPQMKAVVYDHYGRADVLQFTSIPRPVPRRNEVCIKVSATTVTAADWRLRKADPFLARLFNGLFRPGKIRVLGAELSGIVEETGEKVTRFKKGDAVFASCEMHFGAYAEYTCLPDNEFIAHKPANITFEEAAAVPLGGLTALRFLQKARLKKNDFVLVYGASGSVGTYAVQIAKSIGCRVTAVCSTDNIQLVRRLGADDVIDYKTSDFTRRQERYKLIFDAVGKTSKSAVRHMLEPGGKFLSVWGIPPAHPDDFSALKKLVEGNQLKPVIDRRYTFDQIREAHAYVESFRKKGNVIVTWGN